MGGSSGFSIDLVLYGMIAAFLVLRLRGILGKRTGYEHPPKPFVPADQAARGPVIDGRAEPAPAPVGRALPDPASPVGQALRAMQGVDRNFSPGGFLAGAEHAFRMIVTAFAAGDRATLRTLLADMTFAAFDAAITARDAAGHHQQAEIRAIPAATVEAAELHGSIATLTVRFVSDQISLTLDAQNHPVAGTDAVTEITDLWSFERDLARPDPIWRLVSARSA